MQQQKTIWKIGLLTNWEKNPRGVKKDDFERLKRQIERLGQYKPLLITPDGTVLGGNMRLRAYRELGLQDIWVSIVEPENDAQMVEYALSDNDRIGYYEGDQLAELIAETPGIELDDYRVDTGDTISLRELVDDFGPSDEDGPRLDQRSPAKCPVCKEPLSCPEHGTPVSEGDA